ncbi:MAG: hypothetical protein Kow0075_13970 [Salibacteraceae bacterium]
MKKLALILALLVVAHFAPKAQGLDPMLSMYHFHPMSINPAFTGTSTHKWRFGGVYREHGYTIGRPYRTFRGSYDMNLPINAWGGNIWGIGIDVLNDDQGESFLTNRNVNLALAVGQYLDAQRKHSISVGFLGGMGTRSIDYSNSYWNEQWRDQGFNLQAPSGENLTTDLRSYFDISTGINYEFRSGELVDLIVGGSMYHVNRPDNSLLIDLNQFRLERRYNLHAELIHRIRPNSMFATRPSLLYTRQHDRANIMLGNRFQFLFNEGTKYTGKRNESSMMLGLFVKYSSQKIATTTDLVGTISFEFAGFNFGAGYDIPLGSYNVVNGYEGGVEFMISYRAGYNRGIYNKYSRYRKGA